MVTVMENRVESLVEAIFSLKEPWRGRFLILGADQATNGAWNGTQPGREEMMAWLGADPVLYQQVKLLLNAWRRPGR